jgi:uncharacterized membrane protein
MKIGKKELAVMILLAAAIHVALVVSIPEIIMMIVEMKHPGGSDKIYYSPLITADSECVVAQSPDLLYSSIFYDVSRHPLGISAVIPENTYWSISMFNSRTDNYFSLNDIQAKAKKLRIALVSKKMKKDIADRDFDKIIEADTDKGIILLRMLLDNRDDNKRVKELVRIQRQSTCFTIPARSGPNR